MRALRTEHESPGLLVETVGPLTWTGVARDRWSTPGALGPSTSSLGQLFSTAAPSTVQSRPGCWSKLWALGHGPESPESLVDHADPPTGCRVSREGGRLHRHSDPGPSHLGQLVDPKCIRTRAPVAQFSWSTPQALGRKRVWPGRAGPPRRASGPGRSPWDSFMTPWALGPGQDWPGTAGRPRLPGDQAQVAWERYSTLRHLRHGPESPEMLVETVGPRARA